MKKLVICQNKGFHMTFENGLTASVQWGLGNYCDNRFNYDLDFSGKTPGESNTAEVAVFNSSYDFMDIGDFVPAECYGCDDQVAGYLTPDHIAEFLMNVKNYKAEV
jgi:hypothetical protein